MRCSGYVVCYDGELLYVSAIAGVSLRDKIENDGMKALSLIRMLGKHVVLLPRIIGKVKSLSRLRSGIPVMGNVSHALCTTAANRTSLQAHQDRLNHTGSETGLPVV